jgi:hypothetical protein
VYAAANLASAPAVEGDEQINFSILDAAFAQSKLACIGAAVIDTGVDAADTSPASGCCATVEVGLLDAEGAPCAALVEAKFDDEADTAAVVSLAATTDIVVAPASEAVVASDAEVSTDDAAAS